MFLIGNHYTKYFPSSSFVALLNSSGSSRHRSSSNPDNGAMISSPAMSVGNDSHVTSLYDDEVRPGP